MDPLTVISLTCNVIALVEVDLKTASKYYEIHRSGNVALKENVEIGGLSKHLTELMSELRRPLASPNTSAMTTNCSPLFAKGIEEVAKKSEEITKESLKEVSRLKVSGGKKCIQDTQGRCPGVLVEASYRNFAAEAEVLPVDAGHLPHRGPEVSTKPSTNRLGGIGFTTNSSRW